MSDVNGAMCAEQTGSVCAIFDDVELLDSNGAVLGTEQTGAMCTIMGAVV